MAHRATTRGSTRVGWCRSRILADASAGRFAMSSHIANGQNGATTAVQQPSTSVQRIPVAVEVARTPDQTRFWQQQQQKRSLHDDVRALAAAGSLLIQAGYLTVPASLRGVVLYIRCLIPSDLCDPNVVLPFSSVDLTIHVYTLTDEADELEELQPDGDEEAEAPVIGGTTTTLPHKKFDDLWENLYYDEHIKNDVLEYSATALEMAQHGVPTSIVSCNRLILLHGPPGTGSEEGHWRRELARCARTFVADVLHSHSATAGRPPSARPSPTSSVARRLRRTRTAS